MNIAIFGASGAIGILLVKRFLENGDSVYAYIRNPDKINIQHPNLHLIQGELSDEPKITKAVASADIIISTLGPALSGKRNDKTTSIADGHKLILSAMEKHKKSRLITLATPSLKSDNDPKCFLLKIIPIMARILFPWAYRDMVKLGELINGSKLDWTVIRIINPNVKTSGKGYATSIGNESFKMGVSRENIADIFYDIAKANTFIQEMPIVFNKY